MKHMIVAALIAACVTNANAQETQRCGPHEEVLRYLETSHEEFRQLIAITTDGSVVEITANVNTGSWTILQTKPGDETCLITGGGVFMLFDETINDETQTHYERDHGTSY